MEPIGGRTTIRQRPWHAPTGRPTDRVASTSQRANRKKRPGEFVAKRTGARTEDIVPQLIAYATLGAAVAAYEQWLRDEDAELEPLLDLAMGELKRGFGGHEAES